MSYTVLARRYRSLTFDDIVGQDPIARTLRNAIDADRTAHAYLFCGTRGVGKTSMARIFARELNVSSELQERDAIGNAILRGDDLDVIEIDGASNRGVQEARDLIAASGLSPTRCTYRIYIIDEVHMLTTPAFNALLKTMEEPPPHVKFILCTTEPHKVPATIQSRCQRFDFRAISSEQIAAHLMFILEQEGVQADADVVAEVARLGNGSMRDALSLLDRLLAGGGKVIASNEMEFLLGLPSQQTVTTLCLAISKSDMNNAFLSADALISSGIALDRVLEVVANTMRHALVARVCGVNTALLEISDEAKSQAVEIGEQFDEATLTHIIALCDATGKQVRRGGSGRALFDATIARVCLTGQLAQAGGVLKTSKTSTTKSIEPKKKRVTPNSPPKSNTPQQNLEELPKTQAQIQRTVTWQELRKELISTAGLKLIVNHLVLESFEANTLKLSIAESGFDTSNYILSQSKQIEEVVSKCASKKITVHISMDSIQQTKTEPQTVVDSVEPDELIKTARGLFGGTIVKIKKIDKGSTICH